MTLGVGIAGSGQKNRAAYAAFGSLRTPRRCPPSVWNAVRLQRATVSAITLEHCPPSAWNRVRHRVEYAPRQLQAVQLIAAGKSQRQTAKEIGVSYQTVCGWAARQDFKDQLQALLRPVQDEVQTMLRGLHLRAAEVLSHLLETSPPATRFMVARTILEAGRVLPPLPQAADAQDIAQTQFHHALANSRDVLAALGVNRPGIRGGCLV